MVDVVCGMKEYFSRSIVYGPWYHSVSTGSDESWLFAGGRLDGKLVFFLRNPSLICLSGKSGPLSDLLRTVLLSIIIYFLEVLALVEFQLLRIAHPKRHT